MEHHGYMISKELYGWILENIPKGSTILEIGSGDGTQLLSKDYKMYSVENNLNWVGKFKSTYIVAPIKGAWYDVETLESNLPKEYDFILVDAPPAFSEEARMGFFHNIHLFNTDVPIVIDDTNRAGEKKLADNLKAHLGKDYEEIECSQKSFCVFA